MGSIYQGLSVVTEVVAGQPNAPGADVDGQAFSAVFNRALGVAIAADQDTMYVVEGTFCNPHDFDNQPAARNVVRKIINLRNPTTRTVSTWGTVKNYFFYNWIYPSGPPEIWGVNGGCIRVGQTTGRVYVTVVVEDNYDQFSGSGWPTYGGTSGPYAGLHSPGLVNIGYFNPDGTWGGTILPSSVEDLTGFWVSDDEQTFMYTWTSGTGHSPWVAHTWIGTFDAWRFGRFDVATNTQNDDYMTAQGVGYSAPFFGPYGGFVSSGGVWLDTNTGVAWWGADDLGGGRFCQAEPIDYSTNGDLNDNTTNGVQGWFPKPPNAEVVAVMSPASAFMTLFNSTNVSDIVTVDIPGVEFTYLGGGQFRGGGFMDAANGKLYYHDQGAVYALHFSGGIPPLRLRQREDGLAHGGVRQVAGGKNRPHSVQYSFRSAHRNRYL